MSSAPSPVSAASETRNALVAALVCYCAWGVLPLLFMALAAMGYSAPEILAHRVLWSAPFALLLVLAAGQWSQTLRVLSNPRTLGWLALSTVMIIINWGLYVWATTHHHTIEASLGYYINPLLNMAAGMFLFREKIDRWGWVAIGLAAVGVLVQALALGRPPWLSLGIAVSFAAYGVIRKRVAADAQTGLFVECLLMLPFGAAYLIWLGHMGQAAGFATLSHWAWSIACGVITTIPLALFAWSARRLPLSTIGFLQFLAPTLQFSVGVMTGEPLTPLRILSFAFIWAGAAVFALAALWRKRTERQAIKTTVDAV